MGLITGIIGAITAGAVAVTEALAVVGMAVEGLKVIGNALTSIAKTLGIIKPERKVEDLGDRALQAETQGMDPEDYPDYASWVRAIEEDDWGYDPERNKDIPLEQKILKGIEVSTAVAMERFPQIAIDRFFSLAADDPDFFTVERMDEIAEIAADDSQKFADIVNYITGEEKDHSVIENTVDTLMDIEKGIHPDMSERDAYIKVASFRKIEE